MYSSSHRLVYYVIEDIGRYQFNTSEKRHYFKPKVDITIDSQVDVDFARLLNQKDHNEDNCFKSRTCCVLCFSSCPVLWINRFQDGIGIYT